MDVLYFFQKKMDFLTQQPTSPRRIIGLAVSNLFIELMSLIDQQNIEMNVVIEYDRIFCRRH